MSATVKFSIDIDTWVDATIEKIETAFKHFAIGVVMEMSTPVTQGGALPYRTGNLRRSLWVTTGAMAPVSSDSKLLYDSAQDFIEAVNAAKLGDTISASFRAPYGPRINYGFVGADSKGRSYNQGGYGFVEHAELSAPRILNEVVASLSGAR